MSSSLIIEEKAALDSLANAIIGANKTITDSSATKSGLIEMINNIVPEKSKFSSGIIIPATEITTENMPEIPFNLGKDDSNNVIIPDIIFIYQPEGITENTGNIEATLITVIQPSLVRNNNIKGVFFSENKLTSGNNLVAGTIGSANTTITRITDSSFFLAPKINYPWQAKMPIVWMQIKF